MSKVEYFCIAVYGGAVKNKVRVKGNVTCPISALRKWNKGTTSISGSTLELKVSGVAPVGDRDCGADSTGKT